jgi:enolase
MTRSPETICRLHAREILDSRGDPTIEVEVFCAGGAWGRASVPAGASTGRHEAVELRDQEPERFAGRGVRRAVRQVLDQIAPQLIGLPVTAQAEIDRRLCQLDGTPNKSRLGANALLGVSLACARAAACARGLPLWRYLAGEQPPRLPLPMVNLISGGLHAGGNLDIQDFLFLPIGARSYSEALVQAVAVYRALKEQLRRRGLPTLVGDEGGFGPPLERHEQALELLLESYRQAGLTPGKDAAIALDAAASHFYRRGYYQLRDLGQVTAAELIDYWQHWVDTYPIRSIEDALAEDDWEGWQELTRRLGRRLQLIGDDLFATNPQRLQQGQRLGVANSILIKVNQIGTLTEALEVLAQARAAGYRPVLSARSGETEDPFLADLAVATAAGQIKIGSVVRSERLAKYNQLLRLEEELGPSAFTPWQELPG